MDSTTARIILANLRDRIEIGNDKKYRLSGVITQNELDALDYLLASKDVQTSFELEKSDDILSDQSRGITATTEPPLPIQQFPPCESEEPVSLNLTSVELPKINNNYRVCLDFGTAMSKATFVHDDDDFEDIHVLKLGIPGDQEQIDEIMLVSSVYIDIEGLLWFGQHAVEHAEVAPEGKNSRIDNIKRALSEDNLDEPVSDTYNPTKYNITYEDVVLAYLTYFTWTVNRALNIDLSDLSVSPNFRRRFAMPCFPRPNARKVENKLKNLLGEAQILSDTFDSDIHKGLPLKRFLTAVKALRSEKRDYKFIDCSITEPLGVAGSLLSWNSSSDLLALVVDIGAGTSDFSLYRMNVVVNDRSIKSAAGEVDGSARGITEAGNHLDKILIALILRKSGVTASHPKYRNIIHDLERYIRLHKESLFGPASEASLTLYTGDPVDITLDEFLEEPAVKLFEKSLRTTMVEILESVDSTWVNWVCENPTRRLVIVLTGGGANLPMVKRLAEGTVTAHGLAVPVAAAKSFPDWLKTDYPDLEDHYSRIAVSLGGARKNTINSIGVLKSTGFGNAGFQLEKIPTRGN